ncbi:MAG TPA: hypothetical protein VFJ19_19635 [Nocardioidaceae bacterium]|nr:hypothetical protein [Nocardioidaceae bacterium]
MATSTSFRLSEAARRCLASRAVRDGLTVTELLEQLIVEGVDQREHPGVVFRGPSHDRRAGLAGGPDVWEIVARLQELDGREEARIEVFAAESELHPRQIRLALDYAAEHSDPVRRRIDRNRELSEHSRAIAEQRAALLS